MNKLLIIFFLLFCSPAYAGDYVCWDTNGRITHKYISVDGSDLRKRANCMKISRQKIKSLTRYSKVNRSIVGDNDSKIVEMTDIEKAELNKPSASAKKRKALIFTLQT